VQYRDPGSGIRDPIAVRDSWFAIRGSQIEDSAIGDSAIGDSRTGIRGSVIQDER
jgi:hypothetical protein